MSVYVSGMVWKHSRARGTAFTVLLAIADKCDDNGVAYPKWDTSMKTLAAMARCGERAAQYAIKELIELGELSRKLHNGSTSNTFQVHLDRNFALFEGPPPPVDKTVNAVQKRQIDNDGGVHGGAGEGCTSVRELVHRGAPNPSSVITHQPTQGPARKKTVDKTALPEHAVVWIEAGLTPPLIAWGSKHGFSRWLQLHFDYFCDYLRANTAYAHEHPALNACFMNSVRADWGDVKMKAQREERARGGAPGGADPAPTTCSYCPRPWVTKTGGYRACNDAEHEAMSKAGERPKAVSL